MKIFYAVFGVLIAVLVIAIGVNHVSAQEPDATPTEEAAPVTSETDNATPSPIASDTVPTPAPSASPASTTDRLLVEDRTTLDTREHEGTLPDQAPPRRQVIPELSEETRPTEAVVILGEESDETKPGEAGVVLEGDRSNETRPTEAEVVLGDDETSETRPTEVRIVRNDDHQEETKPTEVQVTPRPRSSTTQNGAIALPEEPATIGQRNRPALVREHIPGGTDADVRFIPNGELHVREYTGNTRADDDAVILDKK